MELSNLCREHIAKNKEGIGLKNIYRKINQEVNLKKTFLFTIRKNKNTLTGLKKCTKTTRHHAFLSLRAKSKETNDAKSRKRPKTSTCAIF